MYKNYLIDKLQSFLRTTTGNLVVVQANSVVTEYTKDFIFVSKFVEYDVVKKELFLSISITYDGSIAERLVGDAELDCILNSFKEAVAKLKHEFKKAYVHKSGNIIQMFLRERSLAEHKTITNIIDDINSRVEQENLGIFFEALKEENMPLIQERFGRATKELAKNVIQETDAIVQ